MAPPDRHSPRRPAARSEDSGPEPQDSTRVESVSSVRRHAPREDDDDEGMPAPAGEDDDNPDATRAGPPLTLEIIEGPDQGRRKRFNGVRMVIGRGENCDLTLLDQSVSRRHVELVFGGESGVMLRDLVSGNGTRVNDERVDECKLKHDDVIAIGKTKLRLIDEQERIQQLRIAAERKSAESPAEDTGGEAGANSEGGEPAPDGEQDKKTQVRDIRDIPLRDPPKSTNVRRLAAAALLLLLAVIGAGVLFTDRGPPPPPPPNPKQELAQERMRDARNAFRRADYAEAVKLAEEADTAFPGVDTEGFLVAARKELAIVQAFEQARQLAGENKFDEARALLAKTPPGTALKTEELRDKLEAELVEGEIAWRVKQVELALEARDAEGARALIRLLPQERQPLYLGKLAELDALLAQEAKDAASQERARKAAAARRAKEQREAFIASAFSMVETRFNAGDYARAALECDRVIDAHSGDREIRGRAKLLKKLIPQFARLYQDAQRKLRANALESAARPLRSAAELYRQIGFVGPVGDTLNGQLAASAVVAGKAALARNDVANAASFFSEALRLHPDDAKAQEGLESVQGRLDDLFKQAYVRREENPEDSARKFRLIARLAAEGSELKSKAEAQLQALDPSRVE